MAQQMHRQSIGMRCVKFLSLYFKIPFIVIYIQSVNQNICSSFHSRNKAIHSSLSSIASMEQKKATSSKWQNIVQRVWWRGSKKSGDLRFELI